MAKYIAITKLLLLFPRRRGPSAARIAKLNALAADKSVPLAGRVAAIFTLKQINGAKAQNDLLKLAGNADIAEFALRALTDRKGELKGLKKDIFVNALNSKTPRLRAQALISLGRLGDASAATAILPHAAAPKLAKQPSHNAANPIGVIPHLATRTLVALRPVDAFLDALDGTHGAAALSVLKYIHDDKVVVALTARAAKNPDLATLATLVRLYHREGQYTSGWWGTRPDTSGPYFAREKWSGSAAIEIGLKTALAKAPKATVDFVKTQLAKHKVSINGLPTGTAVAATNPDSANAPFKIAQPTGDPKTWIATLGEKKSTERALKAKGNAARGKKLFTSQACIACHTTAAGQTPKGPHLVDIGKRYKPAELLQSILNPNAVVAQGFDTYVFTTRKKETHVGFVTSESADTISIRTGVGVAVALPKTQIAKREKIAYSSMPPGLTSAITPEQLADLLAYLQSLKSK
ncbi:MAG TPA: c-type cytochrome [Verrucomicrobiales bacterium]|nr:c-type cytochrome [Verrucomicrobiales bacterium]